MKCIMSIMYKDLTHNLKLYKKIFKGIQNTDDEYITMSLRPHSTIVDLRIQTIRLEYITTIFERLAGAGKPDCKAMLDMLLEVFHLKNDKKFKESNDSFELWMTVSSYEGIADWTIYPIDLEVYKVEELKLMDDSFGISHNELSKHPEARGTIRYNMFDRCFEIESVYKSDSSKYDITGYFSNNYGIILLLLHNIGRYGSAYASMNMTKDNIKYNVKISFAGIIDPDEIEMPAGD